MSKNQKNKREVTNLNHNQKNVKNKKTKKRTKILNKILLLLLLILIILVIGIAYKTKRNGGGMQGLLSTLVGHNEETLKNLKPIQVLLMGVSTDNGGKLTDTIIIGTYDPKNQKASLLSIPRDTFVGKKPSTGTGSDKINSLYQKGPEKTLEKVNELTGLDIKYYMVIDNQALIKLVDVIGGVEFEVPTIPGGMVYDDSSQDLHINLQPGLQILDGDKAEQLLRFRKNNDYKTYPAEYGGDDYGRMRTQREFMIETVKQTIKAKNILKIKDIIDIAYEYVETNLSIATIKDYVPYAININIDSIQSEVLPGASYGPTTTPSYPLWFFVADKKETAKLVEELYGSEEETEEGDTSQANGDASGKKDTTQTNGDVSGKKDATQTNGDAGGKKDTTQSESTGTEVSKKEAAKVKIELLNGTGSKDAETKVKKALENKGYTVSTPTTTTTTSKTTIINKTDVDAKFTNNIKELLGVGNVSTSSVSSSKVDITIIIGKDYNK